MRHYLLYPLLLSSPASPPFLASLPSFTPPHFLRLVIKTQINNPWYYVLVVRNLLSILTLGCQIVRLQKLSLGHQTVGQAIKGSSSVMLKHFVCLSESWAVFLISLS